MFKIIIAKASLVFLVLKKIAVGVEKLLHRSKFYKKPQLYSFTTKSICQRPHARGLCKHACLLDFAPNSFDFYFHHHQSDFI